jgi:hypothetical protein
MQLSLFAPLEKGTPKLALTNIEYLCLKMHAHPGMPARWYLRELHRYRFGTPGTGSWNALYFAPSGNYRGRFFVDEAPKLRPARGMLTRSCSRRGEFRLTLAGVKKAKLAAAKIGLDL